MVTKKNDNNLEKNKTLAHRFHMEIIGEFNLGLADEIIAPDCVFHSARPSDLRGPERAKNSARFDQQHFDDKGVKFVHDIVLAEGDLVAFHWINTGNNRETGEAERFEGLDMVRIKDDKIAEVWIEYHKAA